MICTVPRVILAGTGSGCGKTTVTCGILQAMVNRRLKIGAFKCGPDYIDPMFHSRIIGTSCTNLDLFFFPDNTANYLLAKNGAGKDINIIEGVMGFYDGMGITTTRASTYHVAQVTKSPVVLVADAKGTSLSVLAAIAGFLNFCPDNTICGVILNRCSPMVYSSLARELLVRFAGRIRPLGYFPSVPQCVLESRHLGLVTAQEIVDLSEKLQLLAEQAEKTLDLDGLLDLAQKADAVHCREISLPAKETVRIGVARDHAFCFYYADNLDAMREMGAELVPFSPLSDRTLPKNLHGLYLGGGYPELYARRLSENISMRKSIRTALLGGLPCIAECGGFMYLTEAIEDAPMVGFFPGKCFDTGKLTRFGYVKLKAKRDNLLCPVNGEIAAHEFHHWDARYPGEDFTAVRPSGKNWSCIHATDTICAGFPHFHFYANPDFAIRFYDACRKEKHSYD